MGWFDLPPETVSAKTVLGTPTKTASDSAPEGVNVTRDMAGRPVSGIEGGAGAAREVVAKAAKRAESMVACIVGKGN